MNCKSAIDSNYCNRSKAGPSTPIVYCQKNASIALLLTNQLTR